jgi:hypothetical protein
MLDTNQQDDREFAALVGIDWADQKHAWALHSCNASEVEGGPLDYTPEAVECWAAELARRFGGRSTKSEAALSAECASSSASQCMLPRFEDGYLHK